MKKLFLALLLVAPVLLSSCSKEETTIVGLDPFENIEFDKRLPVSKSDLVKYEIMRTLDNGKYEYIVFKNSEAGVLFTDLADKPLSYVYCTQWAVSGNNLTFITEKGSTISYTVSKEYKKASATSYNLTVYLKDEKGQEAAYDVADDGSNHTIALGVWDIINKSRNN